MRRAAARRRGRVIDVKKIDFDSYTHAGGRAVNEDSLYCGDSLLIVADGLGGHGGGDKASQLAIRIVSKALDGAPADEDAICDAITKAHEEISDAFESSRTTIALVSWDEKNAYAAHVGDSRIYQFRGGRIIFQSRDHSVCQMYVMTGEITLDEIRGHNERNKLLRALGGGDRLKVDVRPIELLKGDALLLCSDGFWELVVEEDMERTLREAKNAGEWLSAMRAIVSGKLNAGSDNNTAVAAIF